MKKIGVKLVYDRLSWYMRTALANNKVTLVAVTGTIGKTSARIAISKLLAPKFAQPPIVENSYNVPIAIEMNFFGFELPKPLWNGVAWTKIFRKVAKKVKKFPYDVVVMEVNEDDFEQVEPTIAKIKPQIGVITGASPAHMQKLKNMSNVVRQTTALAKYVHEVHYNTDFSNLERLASSKHPHTYAVGASAQVQLIPFERNKDGFLRAKLTIGAKSVNVTTKHVSPAGLSGLAAAASVGHSLGMNLGEIAQGLAEIPPVRGRMNLLGGINDTKLIDDSYNSSPTAAIAALETLADMPAKRHIAVLGSMNELGKYAQKGHENVAKVAAKKVDLLITIGETAEKYLAPMAEKEGLAAEKIKVFHTPYEAGHYLKDQLAEGDLVLVKGSQNGVFAEEVSRIILATDLDPAKVLVRQSKGWLKTKKRSFRK